ncbi:MAG TPA: hypothetical protein PKA95_07240 [Thermomicrobiales bacterium]|nr:hypothetical protein [Thermomicrobiales bacterium]
MDFKEADRQYEDLRQQYEAGTITVEEFDERLRDLAVLDDQNRWWAKSRDTGQWSYHDGTTWIAGDPYGDPRKEREPIPQDPSDREIPVQTFAGTGAATASPQRSVSQGTAIALYALAVVIPIAGAVLWFMYRNNEAPGDRAMAKHFGIIAIVMFAIYWYWSMQGMA